MVELNSFNLNLSNYCKDYFIKFTASFLANLFILLHYFGIKMDYFDLSDSNFLHSFLDKGLLDLMLLKVKNET